MNLFTYPYRHGEHPPRRHVAHYRAAVAQRGSAAQVNVNDVHAQSMSANDRIALAVSRRVGTMWFCYGLAALMFAWSAAMLLLGAAAPDPFPFPFLFFCLGGVMQSLLLPLIMVAQNLSARQGELRAEADYHVNQENAERLKAILATLEARVPRAEREGER